jgi:hypothetical protein
MKQYPSIPRAVGQSFFEFEAHVFDKIDGSCLRFEWSPKRGWDKAGTRTRMLDETDPDFGPAIGVFARDLAEPLERIAKRERWGRLTVFCEYAGPGSFAGVHVRDEPKTLTLFDASPLGTELMAPRDFLRLFEGLPTPRYLGQVHWTRGFVEEVRRGRVEGVTFEGVVGKALSGRRVLLAKAKTQAWVDAVMANYGADAGSRIVNS